MVVYQSLQINWVRVMELKHLAKKVRFSRNLYFKMTVYTMKNTMNLYYD